MIPLIYHDSQWGRSEVVIIYPDPCISIFDILTMCGFTCDVWLWLIHRKHIDRATDLDICSMILIRKLSNYQVVPISWHGSTIIWSLYIQFRLLKLTLGLVWVKMKLKFVAVFRAPWPFVSPFPHRRPGQGFPKPVRVSQETLSNHPFFFSCNNFIQFIQQKYSTLISVIMAKSGFSRSPIKISTCPPWPNPILRDCSPPSISQHQNGHRFALPGKTRHPPARSEKKNIGPPATGKKIETCKVKPVRFTFDFGYIWDDLYMFNHQKMKNKHV